MDAGSLASLTAIGALTGLVWIPHCAAMCGPLAVYACGDARGVSHVSGGVVKNGLSYQLGRSVGYALLGAAAGQIGAFVLATFVGPWVAAALSWMVAVAMLFAALSWWRRGLHSRDTEAKTIVPLRRLSKTRRRLPSLAVGALSTLLPCGALLTGVLAAAGAGSAAGGAVVMLAFSIATAPGLIFALWLSGRASKLDASRRALAMAGLFFVGALVFVYRPIPALLDPGDSCCGAAAQEAM